MKTPRFDVMRAGLALCAVLLLADVSRAQTPSYRPITPRIGQPFELLEGFETLEPTLVGADQPLPGWVGAGHMILLDDGRLLLAYTADTQCQITFSSDDGASWTPPIAVDPGLAEGEKAHRPAIIEADNGDLWLFYHRWVKFDRKDPAASVNDLWAVRSRDGGQTWSEPRTLYEGYVGMLQGAIQTSKGHLVVPLCNYVALGRFVGLCLVSVDGGETWTTTEPIDIGRPETPYPLSPGLNGGTLEPSVAELTDGRLLMLIRTIEGMLFQSISSDGGLTWGTPTATPLTCGGPCNVVRLPSGRAAVAWNPANPDSPQAKRLGSPIGYDRQTIAVLDHDNTTWHVVHDFVKQIEGNTRVVHSTITGLPDGNLLLTMPGRSTLVRVGEPSLLNASN